MADWPQEELDVYAAWLDQEKATEYAEAIGLIAPDFELIDAYAEKMAFQ